jgi:hypothetical protein
MTPAAIDTRHLPARCSSIGWCGIRRTNAGRLQLFGVEPDERPSRRSRVMNAVFQCAPR